MKSCSLNWLLLACLATKISGFTNLPLHTTLRPLRTRSWAKNPSGGGGFGSKASSGPKQINKKDVIKKVQKKYGGTTPQDIARATQQRIEADMQSLPPHVYAATQLYQQLQKWNAHMSNISILQHANLAPEELDGARRAQEELERLYREHDFTQDDLHNVFQRITWDASADAKAARSITGNMPKDIAARVDRACEIVAEAVLAAGTGGRCLDVGCGFGVLVPSLLKAGIAPAQIYGVDLSTEMIRNGREFHWGVNFEASDFLKDYQDSAEEAGFDSIIFCSALHDLPDSVAALKKASSLLRPNGKLVIVHAQGASHVAKQVNANPVLVKRGLPDAEELRTLDLGGLELAVEPAKAGSIQETKDGYLAVLQRRVNHRTSTAEKSD
jgi:2-polyprenyl-3-methyl-5-hydroxy-6-metoxy-1,4-benzoquinol methylase